LTSPPRNDAVEKPEATSGPASEGKRSGADLPDEIGLPAIKMMGVHPQGGRGMDICFGVHGHALNQ